MHKSGFVSIIGRPNVGKSTFLNNVLGQKISIISSTAQTTRNSIKGIYSCPDAQIIFIDTPGIHKPQNELGEYMNKQSLNSLKEADLVLWIVDASQEFGGGDGYVGHLLNEVKNKVILVINKVDLINDENRLSYLENVKKFEELYKFESIVEISSTQSKNIDQLLEIIKNNLEEGPSYYDEDQLTDSLERFIASELIREKIFYLTKQEIPHSVAVEIEEMKELVDEEKVEIYANIVCDRDSQKKILIGQGGQMIKKIKQFSKRDIQNLLGCNVYLELFVKVDKDWRNNKKSLSRLGYKDNRY